MSPSHPGKTTPNKAQNWQRGSRCKLSKTTVSFPSHKPIPQHEQHRPSSAQSRGQWGQFGAFPGRSQHCSHPGSELWDSSWQQTVTALLSPRAHRCGHTGTEAGVTMWDIPRARQVTDQAQQRAGAGGGGDVGAGWNMGQGEMQGEMHCARGPLLLQGLAHVPACFLLLCLAQPQQPTPPLSGILLGCVSGGALLVKCSTHCCSDLQHMMHPKVDAVLHWSAHRMCT